MLFKYNKNHVNVLKAMNSSQNTGGVQRNEYCWVKGQHGVHPLWELLCLGLHKVEHEYDLMCQMCGREMKTAIYNLCSACKIRVTGSSFNSLFPYWFTFYSAGIVGDHIKAIGFRQNSPCNKEPGSEKIFPWKLVSTLSISSNTSLWCLISLPRVVVEYKQDQMYIHSVIPLHLEVWW